MPCESGFCSPSMEVATVQRPSWVTLTDEGLRESLAIRSTSGRYLIIFFPRFSAGSAVENCREGHNPRHSMWEATDSRPAGARLLKDAGTGMDREPDMVLLVQVVTWTVALPL